MRTATISRTTKETKITVTMNLDGTKQIDIFTGIPFFDHMLTALSFYAGWDLSLQANGDLDIDDHHTVEDIGIVLGQAWNKALGSKQNIARFASTFTPMDESLSRVVLDISNRPVLVYQEEYKRDQIGGLSLENIKEFLYAFVIEARITLHTYILYGSNDHHKVESLFKGIGQALYQATRQTNSGVVSTKGVL